MSYLLVILKDVNFNLVSNNSLIIKKTTVAATDSSGVTGFVVKLNIGWRQMFFILRSESTV